MKKTFLQFALILFVSSLAVFSVGNFVSSQSSSDAIAIRVMPNPNHYTIERWYQEQGFQGSPQSLIVDGYQAIRDGRTVYVNAANIDTTNNLIYTNIYLISYTQESENATVDILGQIISHWKFNHNVINTGKCSISTMYCQEDSDCPGNYVCGNESNDWQEGKCVIEDTTSDLSNTKTCLTDQDCPNNLYCTSLKSQIIRDVRRLGQLTDVNFLLSLYDSKNNKYPTLNSGTYIPQMSISTWPSWQTELSKEIQLSSNVIDPINTLGYCGGDLALDTCWDATNQDFYDPNLQDGVDLPDNSLVYIYTTDVNGTDYDICANMESGYDVAEGSVSNLDCNFDIGYFGNIINEPPFLVDYSLEGASSEAFSGMIRVEDPEGNPMNWELNTINSVIWTSWSSAPVLQSTNNPNQKRVFAQIAGNSGTYPIEIIVSDNAGNVMQEDLDIVIGNTGPQIQAEDINYIIDTNTPLDYKAYIYSNNLPDSADQLASNLGVSYIGFPSNFTTGSFATYQNNLGHGLSKSITKIADNRFELNITGILGDTTGDGVINENLGLEDPESEQIRFTLYAADETGAGSTENFNFNVIFQKPNLSLQCLENIRYGQDYGCQVVVDNPTDGTSFSYNNLPNSLSGNTDTGLISGTAYTVGSHNISVTAQNEYGGTDTDNFTLNINSYCGDGIWQSINSESAGGPDGDGREDCDVNSNVANSISESSENKQYGCTTYELDQHAQPVPLGTCTFTGGYCGDGVVQAELDGEELESCDFGGDIADCCVDCAWVNDFQETSLTFQSGESEAYVDKNDVVYINFPQVRDFDSSSGKMDVDIISTSLESMAVVYVTDTSGSMGSTGVNDVIDALVGTGVDGGGAIGDLHNNGGDISVGLVEFDSINNIDYIRDISDYNNYQDLVASVEAYSAGGGTQTADALQAAYDMISAFEADKKFIVILADGDGTDPSAIATQAKNEGIEIYSITYNNASIADDMCYWSSDDDVSVCDGPEPYFYSYQSSNAALAFDSITDDITSGPEGTLTVNINSGPYSFNITGETMEDLEVSYEDVYCDPATAVCSPDLVPITVNFDGQGEVRLYNLRLDVAEPCGY
jgi:hypothetical protein